MIPDKQKEQLTKGNKFKKIMDKHITNHTPGTKQTNKKTRNIKTINS
jgi:hypothetical protein